MPIKVPSKANKIVLKEKKNHDNKHHLSLRQRRKNQIEKTQFFEIVT